MLPPASKVGIYAAPRTVTEGDVSLYTALYSKALYGTRFAVHCHDDVGALRLRMIAIKEHSYADFPTRPKTASTIRPLFWSLTLRF